MDAREIEAMFQEDQSQWDRLVAMLEAHPEESLHPPDSPTWTSRDVYSHLARWMKLSTAQLEARLAGTPAPMAEGTDDEINARWQQKDSRLSLAEARAWAQRAFEERIQAIRAVPSDRWDPRLEATARGDGAEHYASHREYVTVA
jgi:hypothetical protein